MLPTRVLHRTFLSCSLLFFLTAFVFTACGEKADVGRPHENTIDYSRKKGGEELLKGKAAYNIQKYNEAAMSFSISGEKGNAEGMYRLGKCFLDGKGVQRNVKEAVSHFRKAEKAGYYIDSETQYEVGQCFFTGNGVNEDKAEAVEWWTKAANQGHAEAQFKLGECHQDGEGVEQDRDKALKWFEMAADQDNPNAINELIKPIKNEIRILSGSLEKAQTQMLEFEELMDNYENTLATCWNADRDGEPETELRNLVNDAAQRAEANLQTLGAVRTSIINNELSYVDLDFTIVDEYSKVIRFFAEVEKCTPRLSWRRVELRVEPTRARAVTGPAARANNTAATAATATTAQLLRMTGQVRVIKYSPMGNITSKTAPSTKTIAIVSGAGEFGPGGFGVFAPPPTAAAHDASGYKELVKALVLERDAIKAKIDKINGELKKSEKLRKELEKNASISAGDSELLIKLYDLSLALPEDALVTTFRFNDGNCDLQIQSQNHDTNAITERMHFSYWRIARVQQRIVSDIVVINVSLVKNDKLSQMERIELVTSRGQRMTVRRWEPQKSNVIPENIVTTIVALNIFNPERNPNSIKSTVRPGSNSTESTNAKAPATEEEKQLQEALSNRDELNSLLQTLQQQGLAEEQTALLRQRLDRVNQQIERLMEQQKAPHP